MNRAIELATAESSPKARAETRGIESLSLAFPKRPRL